MLCQVRNGFIEINYFFSIFNKRNTGLKMEKFTDTQIEETYNLLKDCHEKYLKKHGVILPKLKQRDRYTKSALVLVYLAIGYPNTRVIHKVELTGFIRLYYPQTPDVQDARHLAAQKGWFIASGGRGNRDVVLQRGEYQLISLEKPYPNFHGHRVKDSSDWEDLKEQYGHRCATCGSIEGEPNIHWPNTITKLQKGHMDPNKDLASGNIIPQCEKCNRADRNYWEYDERGRVIKLANPIVIKKSDEKTRWRVYKILYQEFEGRNPNEE